MNNTSVSGSSQFAISAKIIRADGKVEDLGTVVGGRLSQRILSYIRIMIANTKQNIKKLIK